MRVRWLGRGGAGVEGGEGVGWGWGLGGGGEGPRGAGEAAGRGRAGLETQASQPVEVLLSAKLKMQSSSSGRMAKNSRDWGVQRIGCIGFRSRWVWLSKN